MTLGYAIVGLIIGIFIAGAENYWLLGAICGAAIGVLFARFVELDRRVRRLESSARRKQVDSGSARSRPIEDEAKDTAPGEEPSPWTQSAPVEEPSPWLKTEFESAAKSNEPTASPEHQRTSAAWSVHEPVPGPSLIQALLNKATTWISTGNVPVKVGVIISFIGVGFLLKYAVDKKLLVFPLEFRLLTVAAGGLALLAIGWRLRKKKRVYALSLQGGGLGILFLTVFAALQIWQLLPATLAFFMLVALTVITGLLAVLQNSRMLAILGVVGGFLAPILTSTGQGNHIVLFSYYLVLNGAILGIAWFRAWRGLNLIGWVFTFVVGSLWGYQYYKPELYSSTQPFLILHFLLYQVIAILFALRQPRQRLGLVDGTLVFGTPIVAFALQAALVEDIPDALAISAAVAALFYAIAALWLWRIKGGALRLLTESFTALAVVFATITIPLAFDARWTAASWALEGAALVWVGTRQSRALSKLAGILLVFLSGLAFIEDGWHWNAGLPLLNGNVLGGLLISLSAFFSSRKLESIDDPGLETIQKFASSLLFAWAVLWWLGTGWMEISDRMEFTDLAGHHNRAPVLLLFLSLSAGVSAWLGRVRQWASLRRAALLFLPLLVLLALAYQWDHDHFLLGAGWLVWPLAFVIQAFVLRVMDDDDERPTAAWHFGSLLLLTTLLAIEASWWVDLVASDAWAGATAVTVAGLMAGLIWLLNKRPVWPVSGHPLVYFAGSLFLVASQVIGLTLLSINGPGSPAPWPYVPVFNPFDLAMIFAMLTSAKSLATMQSVPATKDLLKKTGLLTPYKLMLAVAFIVLTTSALVRGVHHFTAVPWDQNALFASVVVQTALSIYWGLLGFTGMIWGARIGRRRVWLAGAAFMALVVLKLFAVDLGNTGTVERIISFIGIGALLLVVGYFAPAPPRIRRDADESGDQP